MLSFVPSSSLIPQISHIRIRTLLTFHIDFHSLLRKPLFRVLSSPFRLSLPLSCQQILSHYAADDDEKRALSLLGEISEEGKARYSEMIEKAVPSLVDILRIYPSSRPPLCTWPPSSRLTCRSSLVAHLLCVLPPSKPRYYSLCAGTLLLPAHHQPPDARTDPHHQEWEFACTIVKKRIEHETFGRDFLGICSTFLKGSGAFLSFPFHPYLLYLPFLLPALNSS